MRILHFCSHNQWIFDYWKCQSPTANFTAIIEVRGKKTNGFSRVKDVKLYIKKEGNNVQIDN
jgi:hypothetical protein